jgi:hypothetical protein
MCDPAFSEELKRFQEYLRNGGDFRRYPGMTQA